MKVASGNTVTLDVQESTNIYAVKQLIKRSESRRISYQHLFYDGIQLNQVSYDDKELTNDMTMTACKCSDRMKLLLKVQVCRRGAEYHHGQHDEERHEAHSTSQQGGSSQEGF